jgi:hypothetical protein
LVCLTYSHLLVWGQNYKGRKKDKKRRRRGRIKEGRKEGRKEVQRIT